jgi:nucleoside-diphosphate-sugar epimerase
LPSSTSTGVVIAPARGDARCIKHTLQMPPVRRLDCHFIFNVCKRHQNVRLVVVTGASGFIGSHVVRCALEAGYTVRATVRDANDPAKTAFLREIAKSANAEDRLTFVSADLLTKGAFDAAFKDADAVIHTAAVVELSAGDPINDVVRPSIEGVENVLQGIRCNPSVKRLVHTSSIAAVARFNEVNGYTFTENDWNTFSTVENGDAYGFAKTEAERLVWKFKQEQSNVDVVVLNPSFVFGRCYTKAHTKASPIMLRQVIYG